MIDFSISNFDIEETMDSLNIPLNACVSKNGLIYYHNLNRGNYIINLGNADTNGTHWVALLVRQKECLYYDSFGMPPPHDVQYFLGKKKCIYNTDQVQDLEDSTCGYYSMAIIHFCHINKHYDLRKCLNLFNEQFSEDTNKNRIILQQYMKNIISL